MDGTTVRDHIWRASGKLSESQRIAANYLLENSSQVAFASTEEFAKGAGVSTATVIRLSKTLGYEGFQALKKALQNEIQLIVPPSEKVQQTLLHMDEEQDPFASVVEMEITYLEQAMRTLSRTELDRAVKAIASARKVGIMGLGVSRSLVYLLEFRLRRFKVDVIPMVRGGRDLFEDLHWLSEEDVLLTFSFLQPWEEGLTSLRFAKQVGITTIVITDLEASPVIPLADIALVAQRGPVGAFHSLVVPNAVVNALILSYAKYTEEKSIESIRHFQNVRSQMRSERGDY